MSEKQMFAKVRALMTISATDDDRPGPQENCKWHVPGRPTAVFECTEERFMQLQEQRAIIVVAMADDAELPLPQDDGPSDALPLDFPYRKRLIAAGLNTRSAVRSVDLTQIAGIGETYADKVLEALDELDEREGTE